MVRFGTKRVEISPPFSIFLETKKPPIDFPISGPFPVKDQGFTNILLFVLRVQPRNFVPVNDIKERTNIIWSLILII